jgi:hypothetical protein
MQNLNNVGNPIYVLGQEIILEFGYFLSKTIENFLSNKWGDDWFENCVIKENNYSRESKNDLNFLSRQILDLNNQNFRLAIAMSLFQTSHIEKPHLDALENIRKSRNFWAHPNREITSRDLNKLALSVVAIVPAQESLAKKCSESLTISEKQGHLSKIADLTSFTKLYTNTAEYKSEIAKSLMEFTSYIKQNKDHKDFNQIFTSQNHLMSNLYANFQIMQAMYFDLLLDNIIELRDQRNGRKLLHERDIAELHRNLNTEKSLELAKDYVEYLKTELGSDICNCDFCKLFDTQLPINYLEEESQRKVREVYFSLKTKNRPPEFIGGDDYYVAPPGLILLTLATCAAKLNLKPGEIQSTLENWNFDVLNANIGLDSDAYESHEVVKAAIRLIAIRNGVPEAQVEKWDLE